jgi:hypothetical protein
MEKPSGLESLGCATTDSGTPDATPSDMTSRTQMALKGRFLTAIGYVCSAYESANDAFDRLRIENADLFPVPRETESFWDAIAEVAGETTHAIDINTPALRSHASVHGAFEALEWADALEEQAFRVVEKLTASEVSL